jgi:hypothetical protein
MRTRSPLNSPLLSQPLLPSLLPAAAPLLPSAAAAAVCLLPRLLLPPTLNRPLAALLTAKLERKRLLLL